MMCYETRTSSRATDTSIRQLGAWFLVLCGHHFRGWATIVLRAEEIANARDLVIVAARLETR